MLDIHSLRDFFQWLDKRPWSLALRSGDWSFAILETIHIIGLASSVGLIMWVDLRLMGKVMVRRPISAVISVFEPWAKAGFAIMFVSGFMLFLSEPMKCYTTLAFRLKLVMLILAGVNIWYFQTRLRPEMDQWDKTGITPWRAKMVGLFSLVLWFGIIVAGRWTAYF